MRLDELPRSDKIEDRRGRIGTIIVLAGHRCFVSRSAHSASSRSSRPARPLHRHSSKFRCPLRLIRGM